jgi:predicted nucleic acid-binding protein
VKVFFDSSALAKRYVQEAGTESVLDLCNQASELCVASIAIPELVSAFCRLQREGRVTPAQYQSLKHNMLQDIRDAIVCDLSPSVVRDTISALEQNVLRTMDAIHIGCALAMQVDVFASADARQISAAQRAGLQVAHV